MRVYLMSFKFNFRQIKKLKAEKAKEEAEQT